MAGKVSHKYDLLSMDIIFCEEMMNEQRIRGIISVRITIKELLHLKNKGLVKVHQAREESSYLLFRHTNRSFSIYPVAFVTNNVTKSLC